MKKQHTIIIVIYIICNIYVFGEDLPRIEPLLYYISLSGQSEDLNEEQFLKSSLLASGSLSGVNDYNILTDYIDQIVDEVNRLSDKYTMGEKLLKLLHDTVLKQYKEDQTRINILMSSGSFNCVSSALLYMAVGKAAGLNMHGVRTIDHAFVSVQIDDDKFVDVETTNEWGFDPGQKKEFTDSFSGSTGFSYVPPGNYSLRRDISDRQMIGLILQNRIAELQRNNNHTAAVPLAVDRYTLTFSDEAKKDMYDTFSNYASGLNGTGRFEKGLHFLRMAIARWGSVLKVTRAAEALVHNYLLSLMEQGRTIEAEFYIEELEREGIISSAAIQSNKIMIYEKRVVDLLNSGSSYNELQPFINKVYEDGYMTREKWIDYTLYLYIRESEILARSEGWLHAYLFVKSAPEDIINRQKYTRLLSSCKGNYVVTVHNRFADLYNNGDYSEAEEIILQGLSHLPGNKTLNSDLQMIRNKNL